MTWTRMEDNYVSGPYYIRKVHGWRPSTPRRNWVWEPHGPGITGCPAYVTLREAKACCAEAADGGST